MTPRTPYEEEVMKELREVLPDFIVQPRGGDKCPTCNHSGTPTVEIENEIQKKGFSPALAYLDTDKIVSFFLSAIRTAEERGRKEGNTLLSKWLEKYIRLANSGDCGFWNPEEEEIVKETRASLSTNNKEKEV